MTGDQVRDYPEIILSARGLSKVYGQFRALEKIDLELRTGSCLAVVGENGAGKSTLVKILSGQIAPSSGAIQVKGQKVALNSPQEAAKAGIAVIPQELAYLPDLTVSENLVLGRWPSRFGLISQRRLKREGQEILDRHGVSLRAETRMLELSLAQRQQIEVTKALERRSVILILDEPTAALATQQADLVLGQLEAAAAQGTALLFISHRLDEVRRLAHDVLVLRDGKVVDRLATVGADPQRIVKAMLGPAALLEQGSNPPVRRPRDHPLQIRNLHVGGNDRSSVHDVSFDVSKGEIVVLYGQVGSGVSAVTNALFGLAGPSSGTLVTSLGTTRKLARHPREAFEVGLVLIPEERKVNGLILSASIADNLAVGVLLALSSKGFVQHARVYSTASSIVSQFRIACRSPADTVRTLSGGNQQKVLVAAALRRKPLFLVLQEPTRGVDIRVRAYIHSALRSLSRNGVGVLIGTSDLDEATTTADRLLVVRNGLIVREFDTTTYPIARDEVLAHSTMATT